MIKLQWTKKGVMWHSVLLIGRGGLEGAEKFPDRWLPYRREYHMVRIRATGPP